MSKWQRVTAVHQSLSFSRRMIFVGGAQAAFGALLAGRMAYLSITQNEKYQLLSESNRVQLIPVPPRRGWIIDRNGKPIAINRSSFRVDLIPQQIMDRVKIVADLAQILALSPDEIDRINGELDDARGFKPVSVADNIPYEQYAAITVRQPELPGAAPSRGFARFYPGGSTVGQLVGYVGAASAKEYERENKNPLLIIPGVKIGKEGLEQTMEMTLRGQPGGQRVEVTARGKLVKELDPKPDRSGGSIKLTIDTDFHQYAARRIGDQSGSVVVLDVASGDILAMPSMPSFDPNNFSDGISRNEWRMLSENDHLPLVDKVTESLYPSGSTIKPLMSLALLQANINPKDHVLCTGSYRVGNAIFHCDKVHGSVAMADAIMKSCDIYFYEMARRAGVEVIAPMARRMGFGESFDLPFSSQRYGTVPDPEWLMRRYKRKWEIYDTVNMSIGQGNVLVNPLQLAVMAGRIASGKVIQPRLIANAQTPAPVTLDVTPEHLEFVRQAMGGVVNNPNGTAGAVRLPLDGIQMAGKTGTAQVRRISMAERNSGGVRSNESLNWKMRDHSLFVAFAPVENPKYCAAAVIEHGGFGSQVAAPMVRDTLLYLFDKQKGLAALDAYEQGIGGSLDQRIAAKTATWRVANGLAKAEPKA
ncbi:penicillin-binding protein 2 [Sphingomonas sp. RB1R13]|uniref:penicillin-binding protein 2 n=1 Tax=Sphingomonas sp. RB1R13 TaxID=3096159 RepID=UPI002FC84C21